MYQVHQMATAKSRNYGSNTTERGWHVNPSQIYSWASDYFCPDCLIYAMIPHHPWIKWSEERDIAEFSTDEALADMGRYFHVNLASHADRVAMSFPTLARQEDLEDTIFCAVCLSLLHQVP